MNPPQHGRIVAFLIGGVACLAVASAAPAQVAEPPGAYVPPPNQRMRPMGSFGSQHNPRMQPPAPQQQQSVPTAAQAPVQIPAQAPVQAQAVSQSIALAPSLLDKPAQPAKVDLADGRLAIHADNSSLIEIMHRLGADAGMTIDGLNKDQRVFGTYGPGDPQEIISELLDGTGYNVVMLGVTQSGTPKQITLTPRVGGIPNGSAGLQPQPMNQLNQDDEDDEPQQQQMQIITPPGVENPQQQAPQQPGGGVRSPQQMLQELQQLRQQQMQQQQGQPAPPPPQQQ